jgi:hypothetical protein
MVEKEKLVAYAASDDLPRRGRLLGGRSSKSPWLHQPGKDREEAIANIKEAIDAYINALTEDGLTIPEERFEALLVVVSKLPVISGHECVKALENAGYYFKR